MSEGELWEILVPCQYNDGRPVRTRHHRVWDARVRAISGGLTILKPGVGQWEHEGELYKERMIPVRIMATEEQMHAVADITIQHYEQLAVMFYRVSERCVVQHATKDQRARFARDKQRSAS